MRVCCISHTLILWIILFCPTPTIDVEPFTWFLICVLTRTNPVIIYSKITFIYRRIGICWGKIKNRNTGTPRCR